MSTRSVEEIDQEIARLEKERSAWQREIELIDMKLKQLRWFKNEEPQQEQQVKRMTKKRSEPEPPAELPPMTPPA